MRHILRSIVLASLLVPSIVFSPGCSSAAREDAVSLAPAEAATTRDARGPLTRGGQYHFVLDESPGVLDRVTRTCADETDPPSCISRIRDEGAREGIRFVPIDNEAVRVQSFGEDGPREEIYMDARFAIERVEGNTAYLRATTTPVGTRVPVGGARVPLVIIEVVDPSTLALEDAKGRMVFRRSDPSSASPDDS